ncbi:MAG: PIG-L family deacetylase [Oscillospiraceae bacterium]|nr:PIG-L family deacetylase [Oscillospiraceae bacterium]
MKRKIISILLTLAAIIIWILVVQSRMSRLDLGQPEQTRTKSPTNDISLSQTPMSPAESGQSSEADAQHPNANGQESDGASNAGSDPDDDPDADPNASPGASDIEGLNGPNGPNDPNDPQNQQPSTLPPANDLTETLTIELSNGASTTTLLDRSYTTKKTVEAGSTLKINAPEIIHALYIIWDLPPGEWFISGEPSQSCGNNGFIHEYIALSSPSTEITMQFPNTDSTICDVYAFTEGAAPQWVQTWEQPCAKADLLLLPTHADDEHLYFAGIMPYYAGELGYRVQVAYLTNHWNEPPRPHELLNGLWTVGIRYYPIIGGFNDRYAESLSEAQSMYGLDNVVSYQVDLLRRFKPEVVVGHDVNGEYGHGVHMLNAYALQIAVEEADDAAKYPASATKYGTWDTPKLYLHLYPDNAITLDWNMPLSNFGGATAYDMAVAGYACHISQQQWAFAVPQNGPTGHKFGLVRSTVGPDIIGGDLFENISR